MSVAECKEVRKCFVDGDDKEYYYVGIEGCSYAFEWQGSLPMIVVRDSDGNRIKVDTVNVTFDISNMSNWEDGISEERLGCIMKDEYDSEKREWAYKKTNLGDCYLLGYGVGWADGDYIAAMAIMVDANGNVLQEDVAHLRTEEGCNF